MVKEMKMSLQRNYEIKEINISLQRRRRDCGNKYEYDDIDRLLEIHVSSKR